MPPTSRPKASDKTKQLLYALSAGYCQYEGCGKRVLGDELRLRTFNTGQGAHIVAASDDGPRGKGELSAELADEVGNVMLLCYEHHRTIDEDDPDGHPEERLRAMKRAQEERVALACGIPPDSKSYVLVYGANIGEHPTVLGRRTTDAALLPMGRYPATAEPLTIQIKGDLRTERSPSFWAVERANLEEHYKQIVRPLLARADDPHVSVFALAPQPLLVLLGTLLSDKFRVAAYQRHREPEPGWAWPELDDKYAPLAPTAMSVL